MLVMSYDSIFGILQSDHSQFLQPTPEYYLNTEKSRYDYLRIENVPLPKTDPFPLHICDDFVRKQYRTLNQSCDEKCPEIPKVTSLRCANYSKKFQEFSIEQAREDFNSYGISDSFCGFCASIHNNSMKEETDSESTEQLFFDESVLSFAPNCRKCQKNTEELKMKSANIIKKFLISIRNKRIYADIKTTIRSLSLKDPVKLLMTVNYIHALIFDKTSCVLIFRLDGTSFPPSIVYKLFTKEKILILETNDNMIARKNKHRYSGMFSWCPFFVYKCDVCKSTVRKKKKSGCRKSKKKKRSDNQLSWIEEIYG